MAEVIHTINNNQYLYEHHREGDKVICDYIGPVGSGGGIRKAKHGGGPNRVTQQTTKQTDARETINTNRDNSRVGQNDRETKSTMRTDETGRVLFEPTEGQNAKWSKFTAQKMPSDDQFKTDWKKSHGGKVKGWGLGKRQWVVSRLGSTREYQVGMWQARVDAANKLPYSSERKDNAYNYGYHQGYDEYASNRRGWDKTTRETFDKKYVKQGDN